MGMDSSVSRARLRGGIRSVLPVAVALMLLLAACSNKGGTTNSASAGGASGAGADKALKIAYISFAVANSYDAPMLAAAQTVAAANNSTLTVFDGNLKPDTQYQQLQDAIASGEYDGILVQPLFGPGLVPLVKDAISKGIPIGVVDQILGSDLSTSDPQVDGLSAYVVFKQTEIGRKQGDLVVQACAQFSFNPCKVGFMYNVKVAALDQALRKTFDGVISSHPEIKVVAEGEAFYQPQFGLSATQDMLQAQPDINVIVSADQGITGAITAVEDAKKTGKIVLIGYGGGGLGYNNIAAGVQYASVVQLPASEGRMAMEDLIAAIRTGKPSAPRDPVDSAPDDGIVTKDNVANFTAEWPG